MCRANHCALLITAILMCAGVAVADEPNEAAQRHYEAGLQEKKDGNMGQALQELNAAITECPTYADAYWVRGWVQADLDDSDGACISFNTFLGLVADDERAAQAREAIGRLGGTVKPMTPEAPAAGTAPDEQAQEQTVETGGDEADGPPAEAAKAQSPAEEEEPAPATPQPTKDQALALLAEAEQALSQNDYTTAVSKGTQIAEVLPDDGRLHLTLALAYGGLAQWDDAFEHAQRLGEISDSDDNRCYIVLTALAPDYPVLARGFVNEKQMNSLIMSGQMTPEESLSWTDEKMREGTGGDVTKQCMYLVGRSLFDFMLFFGYQEQNPQMMQLAHMNLMTGLEDVNCPDALQPNANQWISDLTAIDFLWPQSDIEWEAYNQETDWSEMIITGQANHQQIAQLRTQASAKYGGSPNSYAQYATGGALSSHDIAWRYTGPNADQVAALQLDAAAKVMRNVVRNVSATERALRVSSFLDQFAPEEAETAIQPAPQQPRQQPSAASVLQPQTQIEQYAYNLKTQLMRAQRSGQITGGTMTARVRAEMQRCETLEAMYEFSIGESLASFDFFRQMGSSEGIDLAIRGVWQVLQSAPAGSPLSIRANQVVNAMQGRQ